MAPPKVIVFGATGAVGSAAARTAAELGAEVALALRDTKKAVPGLDAEAEKQGKFTRVQADLTSPASVREAVTGTGAKHAFLYSAHGAADHMRATIEALKASGIELVVFLSSFTLPASGDLSAVPQADAIPWIHAQVEIQLREVFGPEGYVALRPGSFASNNVRNFKHGIAQGEVKLYKPEGKVDNIVPEDIGRVAGTVLAKGVPQDGNRIIYLYGPELLSLRKTVETICKVLGKSDSVKIKEADKQEATRMYLEEHKIPPFFADYMMRRAEMNDPSKMQVMAYPVSEQELTNVEKYSGRKATTLEEWVEQKKEDFLN